MPLTPYIQEAVSSNQEIFQFNGKQAEKLLSLFNDFNADINQVLESDLKPIKEMSDEEKFKKGLAIKIDRKTHSSLRNMIDEGIKSKDWYYEISDSIFSSLGESEGCLFLLLLASTSPRNMLTSNFSEASLIYTGFKQDIESNEKLLMEFIYSDERPKDFTYDEGSKWWDLNLVQSMSSYGEGGMGDIGAKLNNIKKSLRFYIESGAKLRKTNLTSYLSKRFDPYSKTIKGIIDFEGLVPKRAKIFNFAMNLLEPDYNVNIKNKTWYFVTIDSWMIRSFYPYLPKNEQDSIFKHNAKYLYMQNKIIQFANESGLMPHQVQASIWTAKLKQEGREVDSFTKAIQNKQRSLNRVNERLSEITMDLKSTIQGIYNYYMITPRLSTRPSTGFEDADREEEAPF